MSNSIISKLKSASDFRRTVSPKEIISLLGYIELMDVLVVLALMVALLKDLSDTFVNFIPYAGFFLGLLISALSAIFIFLIILLLGGGRKLAKCLAILCLGSLVDTIPIISFLPAMTYVTIEAYLTILRGRKEAAKEQQQKEAEKRAQQDQLEAQAYA